MEKMDGKTMDIVAENVGKLKELFPEAFTEGKVDFEALKEVLGTFVDDRDERYSFTWNGKSKARMIAQTPSTGTLRPCKEESVDWDTTQNIFIEGDNLEVLKLLQKSYHKKVKMIYIDPPYNTGKDFVYKDNFKDNIKNYKEITGQVDGEGRNLSNNPETSGRYHTDWLNMMYPRLKLARNLLKDDGVIFISIDDNEVSNLRKMCDEVFGEENFETLLIWQKTDPRIDRNTNAKIINRTKGIHEYILCIFRNKVVGTLSKIKKLPSWKGKQSNPDNDPRGNWQSGIVSFEEGHEKEDKNSEFYYSITSPSGKQWTRHWFESKPDMEKLISDGRIYFGPEPDFKNVPRRKTFEKEEQPYYLETIARGFGTSSSAKDEIEGLLGNRDIFDTPKPVKLLRELVRCATEPKDIVMDFFAGSASFAESVLTLNMEEPCERKYILVQLPEKIDRTDKQKKDNKEAIKFLHDNSLPIFLSEISKERIRRAAAKIKEENPEYDGDLGFKVFKLDSTNIKPWEVDFDMTERTLEDFISNIKPDRREEDVLYEILLKYGLDLTLPITEHAIAGQKVFDIGMGALIICLSDAISLEVVEGIAKLKDELNPEIMRVVFKDSGFKDDVVKTNAAQILKQAGIVDVRSL